MSRWGLPALIAGVVLILDQATKLAVWHWVRPVGQVSVIPGFFDLTFAMNPGVAFGLLGNLDPTYRVALLVFLNLAALGLIFFILASASSPGRLLTWGMAIVAGGALGNIIDRIRLTKVIDFLDVYVRDFHWHTFNVADAAITVGTGLLLIHLLTQRED